LALLEAIGDSGVYAAHQQIPDRGRIIHRSVPGRRPAVAGFHPARAAVAGFHPARAAGPAVPSQSPNIGGPLMLL